jgi:hypothetical protein
MCIQWFDTEVGVGFPAGDGSPLGVPVNVNINSAGYYTNDIVVGNGNVAGTAAVWEQVPAGGAAQGEFGNAGTGGAAPCGPPGALPPAPLAGPPPTWYVPQGGVPAVNNGLANCWTAVGYGIDFTAGTSPPFEGDLAGSAVTPYMGRGAQAEKNWDGTMNPDAWYVKGAVNIRPNPPVACPPNPAPGCVTGFAVTGAFTAVS